MHPRMPRLNSCRTVCRVAVERSGWTVNVFSWSSVIAQTQFLAKMAIYGTGKAQSHWICCCSSSLVSSRKRSAISSISWGSCRWKSTVTSVKSRVSERRWSVRRRTTREYSIDVNEKEDYLKKYFLLGDSLINWHWPSANCPTPRECWWSLKCATMSWITSWRTIWWKSHG